MRFSAKTRLRYSRCIRGVGSGGMEAGLQDGTVAVICLHFTVEKPTASAESRGTYDGLPFRAYFAADLWETKR